MRWEDVRSLWTTTAGGGVQGVLVKKIIWMVRDCGQEAARLNDFPKEGDYW